MYFIVKEKNRVLSIFTIIKKLLKIKLLKIKTLRSIVAPAIFVAP